MTQARSNSGLLTDFKVIGFFTADHAVVENGKAYINGGIWNRINLPSFPATISLSLVVAISVPARAYLQNHTIAVQMMDADNNLLPLRLEGGFRVAASPDMKPGDPSVMPIAFTINGLTLEKAGDYWFILSVDGAELDRYSITVTQEMMLQPPLPSTDDSGELQ